MRRTLIVSCLLASLAGCGGGSASPGGNPKADTLRLGAYSVVTEVFQEGVIPAFTKQWKAKTGRDVTFEQSYLGSGAMSKAIKSGQPVDLAVLSLEDDMNQLVDAKLVKPDWKSGPNKGMLTNSLVVIGHRDGNPKGIRDWDDLTKQGVGVLYPDPKTSGGAKWNVGAIYGYARQKSPTDLAPVAEFLAKVQKNVVNMDPSGRQSVSTFERGTGDALVTYENELLLRKKAGKPIPYIIPPATLLIESPVAIVDANVEKDKNREVAEAFLAFLLSKEGQEIFAAYGFRPIDPSLTVMSDQPLPKGLFRIGDLGGWKKVNSDVFGKDGVWTKALLDGVK